VSEERLVHIVALIAGIAWILAIMWDAFEALVLPRRVTRRLRPTRAFYRLTWRAWKLVALRMSPGGRRETYLSFYGPLSLFGLLSAWALSLVLGFAAVHWALGSNLDVHTGRATFADDLYMSGTTFFTLGLGDVTPRSRAARAVTTLEAGLGFGFLAVVIGYVPVVYQAFSRREISIALLDARAGSPPSAGELLRRHAQEPEELEQLLHEWERWSADVLESHLSYPVLSYYRSQHDNQSWLAALTTVLDTAVLVISGLRGMPARQARLTFAMARHAVVDLAQVLGTPPEPPVPERLGTDQVTRLHRSLTADGFVVEPGADASKRLAEQRAMYEPYVNALSRHLMMPLPAWITDASRDDNWRSSAWETREEH
jgi:ion channel